mmetsp:Transcript_65399/g.171921  ORF Transcript_65399/g.171921 Transcript_65399/m.171921 type:complete len:82 (-) Transcript_65399:2-247(-)
MTRSCVSPRSSLAIQAPEKGSGVRQGVGGGGQSIWAAAGSGHPEQGPRIRANMPCECRPEFGTANSAETVAGRILIRAKWA